MFGVKVAATIALGAATILGGTTLWSLKGSSVPRDSLLLPQVPNKVAKGDRLVPVDGRPEFGLVGGFDGMWGQTVALWMEGAARSPDPRTGIEPSAIPADPIEVPRREQLPPNALLNDAQIASLKSRLRLTSDQESLWPAVEVALRDVVLWHARESQRKKGAGSITFQKSEVQRLTEAVRPLLMRMSEDQKREVRTLARVIGLEAVASQI